MERSKKLSVSFGTFACVLEGFDDPFDLMTRVVDYYRDIARENPEFASYDELVDFEDLQAMVESAAGVGPVALETVTGGVVIRNPAAEAAQPVGAADEAEDEFAPTEETDAEDIAALAALDGLASAPTEAEPVEAQALDVDGVDEGDHLDEAELGESIEAELIEGSALEPIERAAEDLADADADGAEDTVADAYAAEAQQDAEYDTEVVEDDAEVVEDDTQVVESDAEKVEDVVEVPSNDSADDTPAAEADDGGSDPSEEDLNAQLAVALAAIDVSTPDDLPPANASEGDSSADGEDTDSDLPEDQDAEDPSLVPLERSDATGNPDPTAQDNGTHDEQPDDQENTDAAPDEDVDDEIAASADEDEDRQDAILTAMAKAVQREKAAEAVDDDSEPTAPPDAAEKKAAPAPLRLGEAFVDSLGEPAAKTDKPAPLTLAPSARVDIPAADADTPNTAVQEVPDTDTDPDDDAADKGKGGLGLGMLKMPGLGWRKKTDRTPEPEVIEDTAPAEKPKSLPETPAAASAVADSTPSESADSDKGSGLLGGALRLVKSADAEDTAATTADDKAKSEATGSVDGVAETPAAAGDADDAPEAAKPASNPFRLGSLLGSSSTYAGDDKEDAQSATQDTPKPAEIEAEAPSPDTPKEKKAAAESNDFADRLNASYANVGDEADALSLSLDELEDDDDGDGLTLQGFVRQLEAGSLNDLMETTAAWIVLVEGRDTFSRGEIMEAVTALTPNNAFSAEARIKAFGKLVRSGALQRGGGGFGLSKERRGFYETRLQDLAS